MFELVPVINSMKDGIIPAITSLKQRNIRFVADSHEDICRGHLWFCKV